MRIAAFAFAVLLGASAHAATDTPATVTVFRDVTVVPMDSERTLPGQSVLVAEGRIAAIGPADSLPIPDGARIIDGRGHWLMPGLAEMHAHLPPVAQAEALERVLDLFLANGVTTVRRSTPASATVLASSPRARRSTAARCATPLTQSNWWRRRRPPATTSSSCIPASTGTRSTR
jgi:imidazolonepropionase-like amidohydrolase